VLVESLPLADYFEACVAAGASPLRASNWVRVEVFRVMNERKLPADAFPVAALSLGRLVAMVDEKKLSTTVAREVFDAMAGGKSLDEALKGAGAAQGGIASEALEGIIRAVVAQNPDVLDEIRSGKDGSGKKRKFLTGLVMKETRGQADGKQVQAILDSVLGELL